MLPLLIGLAAVAVFFATGRAKAAPGALPAAGTAPRGQGILPPGLQDRIALALQGLGVDAAGNVTGGASPSAIRASTALAAEIEAAGFPGTAQELRAKANQASRQVPPPAPAEQIPLPPGIPQAMQDQIQIAIQREGNPAALRVLVARLRALPPSATRDTAIGTIQAIMAQIEVAQEQARTLEAVNTVITSPGIPQPQAARPGVPAPVVVLPSIPIAVPPVPVPQVLPAPKSQLQILADQLANGLKNLQNSMGMPAAKGSENVALVKRFQTAMGGKPDGKAGPGTMMALARNGVHNLPLVMYWPRSSTKTRVFRYRSDLQQLANSIRVTNPIGAQALEQSAQRERGQAGIVGSF